MTEIFKNLKRMNFQLFVDYAFQFRCVQVLKSPEVQTNHDL